MTEFINTNPSSLDGQTSSICYEQYFYCCHLSLVTGSSSATTKQGDNLKSLCYYDMLMEICSVISYFLQTLLQLDDSKERASSLNNWYSNDNNASADVLRVCFNIKYLQNSEEMLG